MNKILIRVLWNFASSVVYTSTYDLSNSTHFDEIGDCDENFYLGNKKVFALRAPFRQIEQTFVFPRVSKILICLSIIWIHSFHIWFKFQDAEKSNFTIHGIRHHDYRIYPSKLTVKKGGIGEKFAVISIKSHPGSGISSVVQFYGAEITDVTYL